MDSPITTALDDLIRRSAPPPIQARRPATEENLKQFKPAPEREHARLDEATSRRLTSMTPSAQYKWASRTLTESAESRAGLTNEQAALISHVIASNETIRDNMVMDVAGSQIKCDRLVQAFRVADDARRPAMAGLTAAALYLNGHHPDSVYAVARHTSDRLARSVRTAADQGVDPQAWVMAIDTGQLQERLHVADRHHYRNQMSVEMGRIDRLGWNDDRELKRPPAVGNEPRAYQGPEK
ncbi:hypothetical protein [Micrococcus terreus]|uniref:Uncharacterized protein n=1 Tax=Micrococcus terreus TaxID=574650 RepID=A0A1I7MSG5_9MICC|nr:hypothetical protein [Micrococcus terreus]SFV24887.1 hypothetical protein SAMN04487966_11511 [Micrococcus terreus]